MEIGDTVQCISSRYMDVRYGVQYIVTDVDDTCIRIKTTDRNEYNWCATARYKKENFKLVKKGNPVSPKPSLDYKFVVWNAHENRYQAFPDDVKMKEWVEKFLTSHPFSEVKVFELTTVVKREMSPLSWTDVKNTKE